ncbi:hypothetical protein O181_005436 [Austropuccinia psidii MF-1]|uniref:Integrase catalytic domain-containing protein n=1 Tax=Austropuccinia psidii MF-1 TaxID=1389203 RepID=A0A9Q3BH90_9BASI|nr:hypothetical protein [Austropuccinia psidii MF-1]
MSELPEKISLFLITHYTKWVVEFPSFPSFGWDFFIIDSPKGEYLILCYYFLYHFNPIIDWKKRLITYYSSHKDSSGINSSTSNYLATAVNSVTLIKDVGEDVAISSAHLFQGDIDLSFHSSLEEQWDEEEELEEIENVLKVVPPAYHQYLDVFSKVKAEKLSPHCACDHYIKLEGLLPPEALNQLQILKEAFTTASILSHCNPSIPNMVETNASDFALGAVLSQVNDSGKHPIAFDSYKLLPVVVDRFSKREIFIPAYGTITSLNLAQILISHVFSKHGLPVIIVSDRGSLFASSFWTNLCQQLKISRDLSASFHPKTDVQTERVNQTLERYLWMYVSYHQDDWHTWLPLAELA